MYRDRRQMYEELERDRKAKVLVYITGDRRNLETQIHPEVVDYFVHHLDLLGKTDRISLFLYTRGGSTMASWSIANLIRQFCNEFEVIVPSKAHSGGTLISLGANNILMTKQATLGPVDPSVNGPLNPPIPGAPPDSRAPVSVEAISGFLELAKSELGISKGTDLTSVLTALCQHVHPLVLGEVYRTRSQIRMLARRLLAQQVKDEGKVEKILGFLCSESGSHDYTINRNEARDELCLNVHKPNDDQYALIKRIYTSISEELQLTVPFDPATLFGKAYRADYEHRRALVENLAGGSHCFVSKGTLTKRQLAVGPQQTQERIEDRRTFEGWAHETI